jgi:hypothetical protein
MDMKFFIRSTLQAATFLAAIVTSPAHAALVSYFLDQSNTTPPFPDGSNYLTVTIDDQGGIGANGGDSIITFTVETVASAFNPTPGSFGIQDFGFADIGGFVTGDSPSAEWILPTNWSGNEPPPNNQGDGFGRFDLMVSTSGSGNRLDPLVFSIDVAGDSIANYIALSSNNAGEGNVFFAAHVAGFTSSAPGVTSAWFGGSTLVPVPAAVWLFGSGLLGLVGVARRKRS